MVKCSDGSQSNLLVRLPGTSLIYDRHRDGVPLKIALLEHGFNRKGKIVQVSEKRDRLTNFLWSWVPESRVYAGVSYFGDKGSRLDYNTDIDHGTLSIDFCLHFESIPKRVHDVWLAEDTVYVASRTRMSEDSITQIVDRGVHSSRRARETIPGDFYEFFSERLTTRLLIESLETLRANNSQPHDEICLNHNVIIDYGNSLRETDVVIAFWNISAFRKLLRTVERLTPGFYVEVSPEIDRG